MKQTVLRHSTLSLAALLLAAGTLPAGDLGAPAFEEPTEEITLHPTAIPRVQRAVGTVRPRLVSRVMAQSSGQILSVEASEGDRVEEGQLLATIDDRQIILRLSQARHGVEGAEAAFRQAEQARTAAEARLTEARSEHERMKSFLANKAATPQQMEKVESAFQQARSGVAQASSQVEQARAGVQRAEEGVAEIQVLLDHTRVSAPMSGVVAERTVDPGDLAWPGRPLLVVQDPTDLRLEAHVGEGLAGQFEANQELEVHIDALDRTFTGVLDEVVPLSDPVSRKFTVKVSLPDEPRLLPGMFGRLSIPMGTRSTLLVPRAAVVTVGQLPIVQVRREDRWVRRLIRLGREHGEDVEVLAGLAPGEVLGVGR